MQRRHHALVLTGAIVLGGCHRTVEEEPEPELIEHRIEPCTVICTAAHDPECGQDHPPDRTVDECIEACASAEPGGFSWAHQEDGTDACAEQWFAHADCIEALSCEERHLAFNWDPSRDDKPCAEESMALTTCFYSTPSLERQDPPR